MNMCVCAGDSAFCQALHKDKPCPLRVDDTPFGELDEAFPDTCRACRAEQLAPIDNGMARGILLVELAAEIRAREESAARGEPCRRD